MKNLFHNVCVVLSIAVVLAIVACAPSDQSALTDEHLSTASLPESGWDDIPVDRQEVLHNMIASYVGGAPQFAVYPQASIYALEWKTLLADSGWTFDHYIDASLVGSSEQGIIIRADKDNEANAHLLQQVFQAINIEPNLEILDGPASDIMLIVGEKPIETKPSTNFNLEPAAK